MKKNFAILLLFLSAILVLSTSAGGPAPANSKLVVDDSFDRAELGDGWHVNTGDWKIADAELKASHPTFAVKKPTLVFRCLGDGVEVDDIKVWAQKSK